MLGALSNQLVVTEEIFDGLLLSAELIFENLHFGFKFHVIFLDLII